MIAKLSIDLSPIFTSYLKTLRISLDKTIERTFYEKNFKLMEINLLFCDFNKKFGSCLNMFIIYHIKGLDEISKKKNLYKKKRNRIKPWYILLFFQIITILPQ